MQTMLDINSRVHTYKQQSQLAVYLNEIDSTTTNNPDLTKLQNVIKSNLICTEYAQAIKAITLYTFPFADIYLADLQPRNLCDINTFNASPVELSSTAYRHLKQLSNRIMKFDITVNNQLDNHIHRASFNNQSVIGPFYRWSNADHRESIRNLFVGEEVVFTSKITKTDNSRMAVKFKKIGITIRTHASEMQSELDKVLNGFGVIMKHMGFSYYRWHDGIYVIASDTSVVIPCYANDAYYKLKNGDAVLSPYTTWMLRLQNATTTSSAEFKHLRRFVNHIDIELE